MIIGIIAISRNFAIGKDGKLPWHYPADLKFFKQTTTGNAIVMGRKTWKSIGKPLPDRTNIVLSRTAELDDKPGVNLFRSMIDVINFVEEFDGDVFVIGGAKTYQAFADVIEKWYVTEVPLTIEDADVFMPRDFLDAFKVTEETDLNDGLRVKVYVRR
jgi:dihydrofolate reductase